MTKSELAKAIADTCTLNGEFKLRSGVVSHVYFDKYLFEANPTLLREVSLRMKDMLPAGDVLAGLEMGGIPLATMIGQHTDMQVLFVRKDAKEYGTCKLAEGGDVAGKRLILIEDVVTSGGAILDGTKALRERGAIVEDVVCVINRESGGVENLADAGLKLHYLFTKSELESA